ncbi:retrovirus-related pol polyprotein from transposon TNT 1-94 [Tanacetum coccineum]
MLLYIKGKEHGKQLYDSVINGPFQYGTVEVPAAPTSPQTVRDRTYEDLTEAEKVRKACDIRATNIVLQGLPPDVYSLVNHHTIAKEIWDRVKLLIKGSKLSLQERESKLYDEFDTFTLEKGKTIHSYYLRFSQLINEMNTIGMSMKPLQLYAYLRQHEAHANEVQLMREIFPYPLALSVQGRQTQGYAGSGGRGNATGTWVNRNVGTNTASQAKVIRCYNCQGEGHMARQCTKPKRPKNSEWFKEKILLAPALESGELTTTDIFQTNDLNAFDSDCDEAPSARDVLMAKLSAYDSNVLSEVPHLDTYQHNNVIDQIV